MFVSLADCGGYAWTGGKIAVFGPDPEDPSPHNRRIGPGFSSKVSQCLPSPERTRWAGLRAPGKEITLTCRPVILSTSQLLELRKVRGCN